MTLPSELLDQAEQLARAENVSVSTIITRALARSLTTLPSPQRAEELMASYRRSLEGFSEEELLLLQGIVLEPIGPDNPGPDEH